MYLERRLHRADRKRDIGASRQGRARPEFRACRWCSATTRDPSVPVVVRVGTVAQTCHCVTVLYCVPTLLFTSSRNLATYASGPGAMEPRPRRNSGCCRPSSRHGPSHPWWRQRVLLRPGGQRSSRARTNMKVCAGLRCPLRFSAA